MTTDDQRRAADEIASEYSDSVRISPNKGPSQDLTVIACPDGRTVVLNPDGSVLADSLRPAIWDQAIVASPLPYS